LALRERYGWTDRNSGKKAKRDDFYSWHDIAPLFANVGHTREILQPPHWRER